MNILWYLLVCGIFFTAGIGVMRKEERNKQRATAGEEKTLRRFWSLRVQ